MAGLAAGQRGAGGVCPWALQDRLQELDCQGRDCVCSPELWKRLDECLGSRRHLRVLVAEGCREECQLVLQDHYCCAQRREMWAQAWRMQLG